MLEFNIADITDAAIDNLIDFADFDGDGKCTFTCSVHLLRVTLLVTLLFNTQSAAMVGEPGRCSRGRCSHGRCSHYALHLTYPPNLYT